MTKNKKAVVANYRLATPKGGKKEVLYKVPLPQITKDVIEGMPDQNRIVNIHGSLEWSRSINGGVPDEFDIHEIGSDKELKDYIEYHYNVMWTSKDVSIGRIKDKTKPIDWGTLRVSLGRQCKRVDSMEMMPHYPPRLGSHYIKGEEEYLDGDGSKLDELMAMLNPETEEDEQLIKAMFLTPLWGGEPGTRPMFVITTDYGRGVGKTTLANLVGSLYGGSTRISAGKNGFKDQLKRSLGTASEISKRLVVIDNVKGRLDDESLESFITERYLPADRLYHGAFQPLNYKTWLITLNGCEMSTDLAQRSVMIKLGRRPKGQSNTFVQDINAFVRDHRKELICDVLGLLRGPSKCSLKGVKQDRWFSWASAVLTKVEKGRQAYVLLQKRRMLMDAEGGEAMELVDTIKETLMAYGIDPERTEVTIPTDKMVDIVKEWKQWDSLTPHRMWEIVKPLCSSDPMIEYSCKKGREKGRSGRRGLLWNVDSTGMTTPTGPRWDDVATSAGSIGFPTPPDPTPPDPTPPDPSQNDPSQNDPSQNDPDLCPKCGRSPDGPLHDLTCDL